MITNNNKQQVNFASLIKRIDEIDKKIRSRIQNIGEGAGFGEQALTNVASIIQHK